MWFSNSFFWAVWQLKCQKKKEKIEKINYIENIFKFDTFTGTPWSNYINNDEII